MDPRRGALVSATVLLVWPVVPGLARAQETADSLAADSAGSGEVRKGPSFLESALEGVRVGGYVESSITVSTAEGGESGEVVVGRTFDRRDGEFMANAFKLALEKPVAADELSAGFRADLLFGQNARVVQSAGLHLGDEGDLEQAFVSLHVPAGPNGRAVTFKAGKLVTLMGLEVIEDVANPTWSEGNQFLFAENFTGTGLEADVVWSPIVDTELRVFNGWDVVEDNNDHLSFMGRVGITPDAATAIGIVGYLGPEQAGNDEADRKGVEVLVSRAVSEDVKLWGQLDYGTEEANLALPDPTEDAAWWAAALWATVRLTPAIGIGLRGDYFDDADGARTSGAPFTAPFPANTGNRFGNLTVTLNVRAWENALVRPEVRYDASSVRNAFGDGDSQVTFALSAAFLY